MGKIGVWGYCPVQGDGLVDGHAWYFRARGRSWRFAVALSDQVDDAVTVGWFGGGFVGAPGWIVERPWFEEEEFAAGWMDHRYACKLIAICLRWWQEGRLEWRGPAVP